MEFTKPKQGEAVAKFFDRFMTVINYQVDKKVEPWLRTTFRNALRPEIRDKLAAMPNASLQQLRTIAVGIESNLGTSDTLKLENEVAMSNADPHQNKRSRNSKLYETGL